MDVVFVMKALADHTRCRLVKILLHNDYCVGALAGRLQISQSAVSQHLAILKKAAIVRGEKRGYFMHYTVDRRTLEDAGKALIALAAGEDPGPSRAGRSTDPACTRTKCRRATVR